MPGRVEQHDCIRQGLERCFQRVLGPHDLADIRPAELGQIFGHLIECARQFAEFVSTFDIDALREPSFAQGIGASRQTSYWAHDGAREMPCHRYRDRKRRQGNQ